MNIRSEGNVVRAGKSQNPSSKSQELRHKTQAPSPKIQIPRKELAVGNPDSYRKQLAIKQYNYLTN
jgi:hypothetical protein